MRTIIDGGLIEVFCALVVGRLLIDRLVDHDGLIDRLLTGSYHRFEVRSGRVRYKSTKRNTAVDGAVAWYRIFETCHYVKGQGCCCCLLSSTSSDCACKVSSFE